MRVHNFKDYKISHGLHSAGGCRKHLFEQEKGRFSGVRDTQRDKKPLDVNKNRKSGTMISCCLLT